MDMSRQNRLVVADRYERLLTNIEVVGDHWIWKGGTSNKRPILRVSGKLMIGYVIGWMYQHGEVPEGHKVFHDCPEPRCVAPDHQRLEEVRITEAGGWTRKLEAVGA